MSEFLDTLTWYSGAPDTLFQSNEMLVAVAPVDVRPVGAGYG
jgi:hypothetical protein